MTLLTQRRHRATASLESLENRTLLSTLNVNTTGAGGAYTDIQTAIEAAQPGDTVSVAAGTYTAQPDIDLANSTSILIDKAITLTGAGQGQTTIVIPGNSTVYGVFIQSSNSTLENLSITGAQYPIIGYNFEDSNANVSHVVIDNVSATPSTAETGTSAIYFNRSDNWLIENSNFGASGANCVTIGTNVTDSIFQGNTVQGPAGFYGIDVEGGSDHNTISGNTLTNLTAGIVIKSSYNQVVGNDIVNVTSDGITLDNGNSTKPDYNFIALNQVISKGESISSSGGCGIFLNSESDYNWLYNNTLTGSFENGIDVLNSSYNLIQGNYLSGNGEGGIFLALNSSTTPPSYGNAPANNIVIDNTSVNNVSGGMIQLVTASNTQIANNFVAAPNDSSNAEGLLFTSSSNTTASNNTIEDLPVGILVEPNSTDTAMFRNRFISTANNYVQQSTTVALDAGPVVGGNYYSGNTGESGDPGSTAYTQFIFNGTATLNGYADAHPFADETLGLSTAVTVTEPAAQTLIGAGTTKTIAWTAPGATLVKIALADANGTTTIADQVPNTGIYSWQVPSNLASSSSDQIIITPEDHNGTAIGSAGSSATFGVDNDSSTKLTVTSPTRGSEVTAGQGLRVTWNYNSANPVNVQMQLGSGDWTTVASAVTGGFADITIPAGDSGPARIRVVDSAANQADTMDGYFQIQNTAAITAAPMGTVAVGSQQSIAWTSPAGAVTVDVDLINGSTDTAIAQAVPDSGNYTLSIPDVSASSAQVKLTFLDASGNSLGSATSSAFTIPGQGNAITFYGPKQNPALTSSGGGGGGSGSSGVSATLSTSVTATKFTGNLVGGAKTKITATVHVTDISASAFNATVPVSLYLSTSNSALDGSAAVAGKSERLKLKSGKPATFSFSFTVPSKSAGAYYLLAEAAPSDGTALSTAAGPANIAPAFVDLGLTNLSDVTPIVQGSRKKPKVTFTLSNAGNIAATGKTTLTLYASTTGTLDGATQLSQSPVSLNVKPNGGAKNFSVAPLIAAGLVPAGSYTLIGVLSAASQEPSTDLANNTGTEANVSIS